MLAAAQFTICDLTDPIVTGTAPSSPAMDTLWLDTSVTPNKLKRWNGSQWVDCGANVDLSGYYTKTEVNTQITQTQNMIASKADASTVSSLGQRVTAAEEKITPEAISQTVASSALYAYEMYAGRNYCLNSNNLYTFVNNRRLNDDGTASGSASVVFSVSDDLFAHSNNGANIRISFDIKRTGLDASASGSTNVYFGAFMFFDSYGTAGGTTLQTYGLGYNMRTTDSTFKATDSDWVRVKYGPLNLTSYNPESIAYFSLGTTNADGTTGTIQIRNVKLEAMDAWTVWSAAPEDIYGLANRMGEAESRIEQNSSNIALKVSTTVYNRNRVYRGTTAPSSLSSNMLWLDTSVTPNLLKRYTGSDWVAAGAEEVKSSGIYIGPNNVSIRTEQFLLQLLDPSNNENVLLEMSADGNVGFNTLYADKVVSDSVAQAYDGPTALYVSPTATTTSDTTFRSLGDAVLALNNRFLIGDVTIYLPYGVTTYEAAGVLIRGITGPGTLRIYGYGTSSTLNSYIKILGCSAYIQFVNVSLREIRSLNGSNRQPYLVELHMNHYIEFNGCTLDANNVTYDSVYCRSTWLYLTNCGLYNALQGLEVFTAIAFVYNCKGSCSWSMVSYAGYIIAAGTVPAGSMGSGNNGQVIATNTTTNYGTAIPVVTPDQTAVLYATTTKSWRGSWRTDTQDVIQGVYSDYGYSSSLSWNRGCMWFDMLQTVLSGATVKSATLTLHRKPGSGSSAAKNVYLCAITNTSASGTPSIAYNLGAIGVIGRDKQVTFAIPTSVVQGLANGTYGGLCLYESPYDFGTSTYSAAYMRMSGAGTDLEPQLEVVYSGGGNAVG